MMVGRCTARAPPLSNFEGALACSLAARPGDASPTVRPRRTRLTGPHQALLPAWGLASSPDLRDHHLHPLATPPSGCASGPGRTTAVDLLAAGPSSERCRSPHAPRSCGRWDLIHFPHPGSSGVVDCFPRETSPQKCASGPPAALVIVPSPVRSQQEAVPSSPSTSPFVFVSNGRRQMDGCPPGLVGDAANTNHVCPANPHGSSAAQTSRLAPCVTTSATHLAADVRLAADRPRGGSCGRTTPHKPQLDGAAVPRVLELLPGLMASLQTRRNTKDVPHVLGLP